MNILDLPMDVIVLVLSMVDIRTLVLSVPLVCRSLSAAAEHASLSNVYMRQKYTEATPRDYDVWRMMERLVELSQKRAPRMFCDVRHITIMPIMTVLNIAVPCVDGAVHAIVGNTMRACSRVHVRITRKLPQNTVQEIVDHGHKIDRITCTVEGTTAVLSILAACTRVHTMDIFAEETTGNTLDNDGAEDDVTRAAVCEDKPFLKHFYLTRCGAGESILVAMVRSMQSLRVASFTDVYNFTDECVRVMLGASQLRYLFLKGCERLQNIGSLELSRSTLNMLYIESCRNLSVTEATVGLIPSCITSVVFDDVGITDDAVAELGCGRFEELTTLIVSNCMMISDEGFRRLVGAQQYDTDASYRDSLVGLAARQECILPSLYSVRISGGATTHRSTEMMINACKNIELVFSESSGICHSDAVALKHLLKMRKKGSIRTNGPIFVH